MSKKPGKGKKSKNKIEEVEEVKDTQSAVEIGYLTTAILDYYEATGRPPLDEGDEWKEGTDYEPKSSLDIPEDLDNEIRKAFIAQIKKFQ